MAEIKGQAIDRFLARPDPKAAIILIHGPDRGRVTMRAKALLTVLAGPRPDPMNLVEMDSALLEAEPARLAEEADSMAMFADRKIVVARLDDPKPLVKPLDALLAAPPGDCVVVLVAGDLKKGHPVRSRIESAAHGVAMACYAADRRETAELLAASLKDFSLTIERQAQEDLLSMLGADHAMSASEIEKLCLYARHEGRITTGHVHAILVDGSAHAMSDVSDAAFAGDRTSALDALMRTLAEGLEASVLTQQLLRHAQLLERVRIEIDDGASSDRALTSVRPPVFFKRRPAIERALRLWSSNALRGLAQYLDGELVATRLEPRLKATRLERQVLRIAGEAARGARSGP